jgi:hypothetical protein
MENTALRLRSMPAVAIAERFGANVQAELLIASFPLLMPALTVDSTRCFTTVLRRDLMFAAGLTTLSVTPKVVVLEDY